MKTLFIFPKKGAFMKQSKWVVAVLALTGSLTITNLAVAQDYVTGTPTLSNMDPTTLNTAPNALYAAWASSPPTVFTSLPSGLEVYSYTYGSLYYNTANNPISINANDTEAVLTLTVNNVTDPQDNVWIGVSFYIDDNTGSYNLGGYAGMYGYSGTGTATWSGNTLTEAVPITGALLTAIQAGGDQIQGFNLQLDPAVYPGGFYDVTFNSLALQGAQPVPEPTSLALVGVGLMGLMVLRRRK